MLNFEATILTEYENAYESAYDLPLKKQYSNPKIYTASGDLSKRWYVYFSFRDPETGRMKRQTPFYGRANKYKTKEERLAVLSIYRQIILKYLKKGYDPFGDNRAIHLGQPTKSIGTVKNHKKSINLNVEKPDHNPEIPEGKTIDEALSFDMDIKKRTLRESSIRSYKSHIKVYREWLERNHGEITHISKTDRSIANDFLNHILQETSARNRNNYRASLSSLYQCLDDNDIVVENFIKKIKVLKSSPRRNKRYSREQQEEIFKHLEREDPLMLLYVKFVAYNFLRPLEVCRLRVGDVDVRNRTISFKAKNSPMKTKLIPQILLSSLPDLSKMRKKDLLFTPEGIGGEWDTKLENRRGYFTKRFGKAVKGRFDLEMDHTLYSFRHTYITQVYRKLLRESSPFEAKSKLMEITGHSSMNALEKYLREMDATLPEDYSDMLIND